MSEDILFFRINWMLVIPIIISLFALSSMIVFIIQIGEQSEFSKIFMVMGAVGSGIGFLIFGIIAGKTVQKSRKVKKVVNENS